MNDRFTVPEHVIERAFGDKTILLSLRSGDYYCLNAVGSFFWKGLAEDRSPEELVASAACTYAQPVEKIEADFAEFSRDLELLGLLGRV
jgi:hypothetical protein